MSLPDPADVARRLHAAADRVGVVQEFGDDPEFDAVVLGASAFLNESTLWVGDDAGRATEAEFAVRAQSFGYGVLLGWLLGREWS